MKRNKLIILLLNAALILSSVGCSSKDEGSSIESEAQTATQAQTEESEALDSEDTQEDTQDEDIDSGALVAKISDKNSVEQNPYLPDEEAMIHNDIYNTDVTNKVMPLGIYSEISEGTAVGATNSPPAFFYDINSNAICPYNLYLEDGTAMAGGIAIRDMDSEELTIEGSFMPYLDDNGATYGIQISYSFVDADNNLVGPTTNGHVVFIRTSDDDGNVLSTFEKVLDVDVVTPAIEALGQDIDTNLLSIVYDYEGNLWFVTGGFRKDPEYSADGFVGYLSREYIDKAIDGEEDLDPYDYLYFERLGEGENAENGIAAHPGGCVILTNLNCSLFKANDGVETAWSVPYESVEKISDDESVSGIGLAWGGGSSPTLTNDLVLFTDNMETVNLIAVNVKTGDVVCETPVLDLGDDVIVSVENSICVYDCGDGRTSVYICNWFGAGNSSLLDPDADSSIQSYSNIYDSSWMENGASCLMPGVERVDILLNDDGTYSAEEIWTREDLKDTSMMKYSTATGYVYGYLQDEESGEWGFIALDADTGETALWQPVSDEASYNNIAVGIMQGNNGNTIYCPTNSLALVRMQDRFVYLPEDEDEKLNLSLMERAVLSDDEFEELSGEEAQVCGYLMAVTIDSDSEQTVAFRVNGLSGTSSELSLYRMNTDGTLKEAELTLTDEQGNEIDADKSLSENTIYEIRIQADDGDEWDLIDDEGVTRAQLVLAKK